MAVRASKTKPTADPNAVIIASLVRVLSIIPPDWMRTAGKLQVAQATNSAADVARELLIENPALNHLADFGQLADRRFDSRGGKSTADHGTRISASLAGSLIRLLAGPL